MTRDTLAKGIEKAIHDYTLACESVGRVQGQRAAVFDGVYRYRGETYRALKDAILSELEKKT